jgi:glyoxylase-like metal-dependent hydrolase (beta-lactamase superfamily II)
MTEERLYLRQLLAGRDYAVGDDLARQMLNFSYLVGDRQTGEAVIVDPAYGVKDLLAVASSDGMAVTGVLVTHYHADHIGGSLAGYDIEGVTALLDEISVPIHVNRHEVPWVARSVGLEESDLIAHDGGDRLAIGGVSIELLHTPGHTPGSQCFLVDGMLISGDTLFLDGCGRTDLPGSDPDAMYESLRRLAALPDDVAVFPGHRYSAPSAATMEVVRQTNVALRPLTRQQWRSMFSPSYG